MDEFIQAYVECALWSSNDDFGNPLDKGYSVNDISPHTLGEMAKDCIQFQKDNGDDIQNHLSQAGHDFWLTRNGHGAGFWDGGWSEEVGERLTKASKQYPEVSLYVGDVGLIDS